MVFWNKRSEAKKRAEVEKQQTAKILENQEKFLMAGLKEEIRRKVEYFIGIAISNSKETIELDYKQQAERIALKLDHSGRTKKEVLAIAYRQIRDSLTLQNTALDNCFTSESYKRQYAHYEYSASAQKSTYFNVVDWITDQDRQTYLEAHIKPLTAIIQDLEGQAQEQRETLAYKQALTQTVDDRIEQIQHQQQTREAELDQQLKTVQAQIEKAQKALTLQNRTLTPENTRPDMDRLENMLEELRRLKGGLSE